MDPDPFLHELSALKQLDLDLNARLGEVVNIVSFTAQQSTLGPIKVKTDYLDTPLSTRSQAPNYDSGLIAIPAALTAVLGVSFKLRTLFLVNITSSPASIIVTDTAGLIYLQDYPVPANDYRLLPFGDMTIAGGLKWQASAAATLNGQLLGVSI